MSLGLWMVTMVGVSAEPVEQRTLGAQDPLTLLKGVGPKLFGMLSAAGLETVRDLLFFFPRRHQEVTEIASPVEGVPDRLVRIRARVRDVSLVWLPRRRNMVTVQLEAADGTPFQVAFFNQPYLRKAYGVGSERLAEGILEARGGRTNKSYRLRQGRILPKGEETLGPCRIRYQEIEGVSATRLCALIRQGLARVELESWTWAGEGLPARLARGLPRLSQALLAMHQPASVEQHERARRPFAVLEAVALFRKVERARRRRLQRRGPVVRIGDALEARLRARIPFTPTRDQEKAFACIRQLLRGPSPMGLLLQGDVGTGKTAVAVYAALAVLASGQQVAFLAPTELLAEQHHAGIGAWLEDSQVRLGLLTSSLGGPRRRELEASLRQGQPQLVFGTQALISEKTSFGRLGLVIVDEQHRFGVRQRMRLVQKGQDPHVLFMTATPIPRTLTLTLFGDLDRAVLRQRPPGHRPTPAFFLPRQRQSWTRILAIVERRLARGQQVYFVCPKVGEEGDKGGVVHLHAELSRRFTCGLVHGQLGAEERQRCTEAFRRAGFQVLVGTTVLEVGVDIPAATLMVIVGAERFGLATLHQLRGRVGRGRQRGLCLLTGRPGPRVRAICASTDGFELAEKDLCLRGSGELLGTRQSGLGELRALDPVADLPLLLEARQAVREEAGMA